MPKPSTLSLDIPGQPTSGSATKAWFIRVLVFVGAAAVLGLLAWQGLTGHGNPNPAAPGTSAGAAIFDIGVLVFREGLECILVLSAITASMRGSDSVHRRPVAWGAAGGFAMTVITWFAAVGVVNDLSADVSALDLQAGTGLLAIVVLLVVMNWFFHKVYWGGWIALHHRRRNELLESTAVCAGCRLRLLSGLGLLGFTSFYREGFEVVLFLQSYRLKFGGTIVLWGALVGLLFTAVVAVLTFLAHQRLPYRRMLVFTGILLGVVLLVMVGEEAQEMQLAHWLPTTPIHSLVAWIPDWAGLWFSVFPTTETLAAQGMAALAVVGSYLLVRLKTNTAQRT